MKRAFAILLVLALAAGLWYSRRCEMSAEKPQALLAQQMEGIGCSDISCDPAERILVAPLDLRAPWSRFWEAIANACAAMPRRPVCCIGTSDQGNISICPFMAGGCASFDETWSLLLVHFGAEGVTSCRAGIRLDAKGNGEPSAHAATLKKTPWEQFEAAAEEWDDWLGVRPEKHVLLFSMSDDCPLADHLPQLQRLFRDCERLGNEPPVFRKLDNRRILINRGNAILLHQADRLPEAIKACTCR